LPTLLSFLVSQELLSRDGSGQFRLTAPAAAFLVSKSPLYVGGRGLLFQGFHEAIGHLPEALATGMPWTPAGQRDMFGSFGPEQQRWFADGMLANAVHGARALLGVVDFSLFRHLLDVGGSAGGYAITIVEANPGLMATIFDVPDLETIAWETMERAGVGDRVGFVAGSFFDGDLPAGHDVLLLSSILHDWGDEDCRTILRRSFAALEAGGTIVVTEPMLRADSTGPEHAAVSGLTMAVLGGENRTQERVAELLEEAGFIAPWQSAIGDQNSVVTARSRSEVLPGTIDAEPHRMRQAAQITDRFSAEWLAGYRAALMDLEGVLASIGETQWLVCPRPPQGAAFAARRFPSRRLILVLPVPVANPRGSGPLRLRV
jgi:hypothetical protein